MRHLLIMFGGLVLMAWGLCSLRKARHAPSRDLSQRRPLEWALTAGMCGGLLGLFLLVFPPSDAAWAMIASAVLIMVGVISGVVRRSRYGHWY